MTSMKSRSTCSVFGRKQTLLASNPVPAGIYNRMRSDAGASAMLEAGCSTSCAQNLTDLPGN